MPVMKTGGREIQLEKVDGRFVKLSIPEEVLEAVNAMPLESRATLLIKAAAQYRLSPEQFEFVISSIDPSQWIAFADAIGRWGEIWDRILLIAESQPTYWTAVLEYALHARYRSNAFDFVREHIGHPGLPVAVKTRFLQYIQDTWLQNWRSDPRVGQDWSSNPSFGKFPLDVQALLQQYLASDVQNIPQLCSREARCIRREIACVLHDRETLKLLWVAAFQDEARCDSSDFGEDDDRDERLEKLYHEATAQLPDDAKELAISAVQALVSQNRKFLAAHLARKLGLDEQARALYLEERTTLLSKKSPLTGCGGSRVGDCSFWAKEYEAAYGYYLVAEDKYGMFKAAWQFDQNLARAIAREIAVQAILDPYYALNGALAIACQAGLPEAQQVYEKGIERLEQNRALESALAYARDYGDSLRVARYQLLLSL